MVRLCISGAMFVNAIVTFPALAVSELLVNFSWPPGSAASESEPPLATGAGEALVGVDATGVLDEAGGLLLLVLLLLLEPPHAARVSATAIALSAPGNLDTGRLQSIG
jgi:hypothetical protein